MEDPSVSDMLKKRFQLFGQFFKGFLKSEPEAPSTVRADQQVYDDTGKFRQHQVLEFQPDQQTQPPSPSRGYAPENDLFSLFGSTRSLFEEFEQTMKIFDDFAFILQHPNMGPPPVYGSDQESFCEEIEDEQDARYFKFFGKGLPNLTPNEAEEESAVKSDENYRDMMLKPSPNEKQGSHRSENSRQPSILGAILDSFWNMDKSAGQLGQPGQSGQIPNNDPGVGNSATYFTFSSEESSLKSDGFKVSVNSTKIRETAEGREIITYKTNEHGVTEEIREFIPRKDLPHEPNPFFGRVFRPRL